MDRNSLRSRHLIALPAILGLVAPCVATATEWYVDTAASGLVHDGSSWINAWESLAKIRQELLSPGDIVWVRSGNYDERLQITRSGENGHPISFVGSGPRRPVLRGIDGGATSNIAIINFEITQSPQAAVSDAIVIKGASDWLFEDNYIHDTSGSGIITAYSTASSRIIIRHNTFSDIGSVGLGASGPVVIQLSGDHNLIEYNSILRSMDRCRAFGRGVVVRNNFWGPTDSSLYPASKPFPNHTDGFQSWEGGNPLVQFLYERNLDIDDADSIGGTNAHGFLVQDAIGTNGFRWCILRLNLLIRPGGSAYSFQNVSRTYVYNSTFIGIQHGARRSYQMAAAYTYPNTHTADSSDFADVRNNTWDYCPNCRDPRGIISSSYWPTHFTSAAQHSYNIADQVLLPNFAQPANLLHLNPLFTDGIGVPGHDDYTLQSNSPLVGASAPIATARSDGSNSTMLVVSDSKGIFDGWGIADADFISIGTGDYVQILSINYESDTVNLSAARSWHKGDRVFVKGTKDIGAQPFAFVRPVRVTNTTSLNVPKGDAILSAHCPNPGAIRKLEFLVDGVPVGETSAEPYFVHWISNGALHKVEARAYNAWASQFLTSSDTISINAQ